MKRSKKKNVDSDASEEELFNIVSESGSSSDDNSDDNDDAKNKASDIEEDENMPDERAWGSQKRQYYFTDQVDDEYLGKKISGKKSLVIDAALQEEEQARRMQQQLLQQFDDDDFSMGLLPLQQQLEKDDTRDEEMIERDLSQLSKRERLELLKNQSPEFGPIVHDFKATITKLKETVIPLAKKLKHVKKKNQNDVINVCRDYVSTRVSASMAYLTYASCYLLLKSKNVNVKYHPCLKLLLFYKELLNKLEDEVDVDTLSAQFQRAIQSGLPLKKGNSTRKQLRIIEQMATNGEQVKKQTNKKVQFAAVVDEPSSSVGDAIINNDEQNDDAKRAITYEMAKNKGLTPKRKKEQRNPRVKHRNKYRNAIIRRKGAIRQVRKEVKRYDGEISGIKRTVVKSVKIK